MRPELSDEKTPVTAGDADIYFNSPERPRAPVRVFPPSASVISTPGTFLFSPQTSSSPMAPMAISFASPRKDASPEHKTDDDKSLPPPIVRPAFPTDHSQLEKLLRRQQELWEQYRHPEHSSFRHRANQLLDNPHVRRKWSYGLIWAMSLLIVGLLYKQLQGDVYFRDKFNPGFSDAQNKDHLTLISTISTWLLVALGIVGFGLMHLLGRHHDEQFDRRANRKLIPYLIAEGYLAGSHYGDQNALEYAHDFSLLHQHLPQYFKTLLLKNDPEAVMAVILSVTQYIVDCAIVNKLADFKASHGGIAPTRFKLSPLPPEYAAEAEPEVSFEERLNRSLAHQAAVHTASGLHAGSGVATTVVSSQVTRAALDGFKRQMHTADLRILRLEDALQQMSGGQAGNILYLDADAVANFPALLMIECKRLMTTAAFRISPKQRGYFLSALLTDRWLMDQMPDPLKEFVPRLINAFFSYGWRDKKGVILANATVENSAAHIALKEDAETFSAMAPCHQTLIIKSMYEGGKVMQAALTALLWHPVINAAQRGQLMLHYLTDADFPDSAASSRSVLLSPSSNQPDDPLQFLFSSTQDAVAFCNEAPRIAGNMLARLFSPPPEAALLKFACTIIWHPDLKPTARKTLILKIDATIPLQTHYIFGAEEEEKHDTSNYHLLDEQNSVLSHSNRSDVCLLTTLAAKYAAQAATEHQQAKKLKTKDFGCLAYASSCMRQWRIKKNQDISAQSEQIRENVRSLLTHSYKLLSILLQVLAGFFPPSTQNDMMQILEAILTAEDYPVAKEQCCSVLRIFFATPQSFNLGLASRLAAFCTHASIGIATIFADLRAVLSKTDGGNASFTSAAADDSKVNATDPHNVTALNISTSSPNLIIERFAAVLIYVFYQQIVSHQGFFGSREAIKQARDNLDAVLQASQIASYHSLSDQFQSLGLGEDFAQAVTAAMALYQTNPPQRDDGPAYNPHHDEDRREEYDQLV